MLGTLILVAAAIGALCVYSETLIKYLVRVLPESSSNKLDNAWDALKFGVERLAVGSLTLVGKAVVGTAMIIGILLVVALIIFGIVSLATGILSSMKAMLFIIMLTLLFIAFSKGL
jgi:hypothetical protein